MFPAKGKARDEEGTEEPWKEESSIEHRDHISEIPKAPENTTEEKSSALRSFQF